MPWLLANQGGALTDTTTPNATLTRGNQWRVNVANQALISVRWYRRASAPATIVTHIDLWDTTGPTRLLHQPVYDSGQVGWQQTDLGSPVNLVANRDYYLSECDAPAVPVSYWNFSPPAPPSPFVFATPNYRWHDSQCAYWIGQTADITTTVDGFVDTLGTSAPSPTAYGDPAPALARYFDPANASQLPPADPGLMHEAAVLAKSNLPDILTKVGDIWDLAGVLTDLEIAAAQALWKYAKQWLGGTDNSPASAVRRADGTLLINVVDAMQAQINSIQAQVTAIQDQADILENGVGDFPFNWVQLEEVPFNGDLAWAEPAHLYVVHFDTWPASNGSVLRAGVRWLPRIGWWTPLNGINAQMRGFIEFQEQHLHLNGQLMPGLLLATKAGSTGTVQAWQRP